VLDDRGVVAAEVAGAGWRGVTDLFDAALVYGAPDFCDHEAEYGLPLTPRYCGWVTEARPPSRSAVDEHLLVVTAGGGGDGDAVFRLGVDLVEHSRHRRLWIPAGPYAGVSGLRALVERSGAAPRVTVATQVGGCTTLFARAGAIVQMAGYNSTFEALAAGHRPVLVPRRTPRREQLIRAQRLAALGLADVVDERARATDVEPLLRDQRRLPLERVADAGIALDGADRAATVLAGAAAGARR